MSLLILVDPATGHAMYSMYVQPRCCCFTCCQCGLPGSHEHAGVPHGHELAQDTMPKYPRHTHVCLPAPHLPAPCWRRHKLYLSNPTVHTHGNDDSSQQLLPPPLIAQCHCWTSSTYGHGGGVGAHKECVSSRTCVDMVAGLKSSMVCASLLQVCYRARGHHAITHTYTSGDNIESRTHRPQITWHETSIVGWWQWLDRATVALL